MPAICRIGDHHACGAVDTEGSPNVRVNGIPVHRIGDKDTHTTQMEGAPLVLANGIPVARIGDRNHPHIHPPSPEVTGSPDTFANGH